MGRAWRAKKWWTKRLKCGKFPWEKDENCIRVGDERTRKTNRMARCSGGKWKLSECSGRRQTIIVRGCTGRNIALRVAKFANNIDVRRIEQKRDRTVTNSVTVENLIGTRAILSSDNSKIDAILHSLSLSLTLTLLFNSIFNFSSNEKIYSLVVSCAEDNCTEEYSRVSL